MDCMRERSTVAKEANINERNSTSCQKSTNLTWEVSTKFRDQVIYHPKRKSCQKLVKLLSMIMNKVW